MLLKSILQAMDEFHSMVSRANARARPSAARRLAENLAALPKPELKAFIASIAARVTLDPGESTYSIQYRIPLGTEDLVASPRGFEPLLPP